MGSIPSSGTSASPRKGRDHGRLLTSGRAGPPMVRRWRPVAGPILSPVMQRGSAHRPFLRRLALGLAAAAAGGLLLLNLETGHSLAANATISATKTGPTTYAFQPHTLTVAAGTRVTWRNPTDAPHTVTAADGAFDSGYVYPGATYARTFNSVGTFAYRCTIHPGQLGTIIVRAASGGGGVEQPDTATEAAPGGPTAAALLLLIALAAACLVGLLRLRDQR